MDHIRTTACKREEQRHQVLVALLLRVTILKTTKENLRLILDFHGALADLGRIEDDGDFVRATAQ